MPQTGATRYQKFLKSEKGKTKLKAKKDLPKGTNVTKTNFKVKKIVIKEQLKKHGDTEALSTRKLNIKELLSRLQHFNVHSRTEALYGIKEVITAFPDMLDKNLGQLIHGITPMVMNIEKVVRRESLKVLHLILSKATSQKIEPFFGFLSTYLRSAMTHIDNRIQEDSLLFLDVLLLCTAESVAKDFHKIIPNFLDMISKLKMDSKPGRTLTINLDRQMTTAKWRNKVLSRLQDFLKKFVHFNKIDTKKSVNNTKHMFDSTKANYHPLFNQSYISNCYLPIFSSKALQESTLVDEIEQFKSYIDTLMPLLFDSWVEVCSNTQSDKNIETVIMEDAAILLKNVLQLIYLLWELIECLQKKHPSSNIKNVFRDKYKTSFTQHIVNPFPFVTNIRSKSKSNACLAFEEDIISNPKMTEQNLAICYLFVIFNPNVNIKDHNKHISAVLNYIEKTFNQNAQEEINELVMKVLHAIFTNELTGWNRNLLVMDSLFRKIIWTYFNKSLSPAFQKDIFIMLCKIALNDKLTHFHTSDAYDKWLKNLPDILLDDTITSQSIDILHMFAVRNNKIFNDVIKDKLLKIVENFPKLKVTNVESNPDSYLKQFSLLYWIRVWDKDSLDLMENQLINNLYSYDHCKYIIDTLRLRSGGLYD